MRRTRVRRKRLLSQERTQILLRYVGLGLVIGLVAGLALEVMRLVVVLSLSPSDGHVMLSPSAGHAARVGENPSPKFVDFVDATAWGVFRFVVTLFMLAEQVINGLWNVLLKHPLMGASVLVGVGFGAIAAYRKIAPHRHRRSHRVKM